MLGIVLGGLVALAAALLLPSDESAAQGPQGPQLWETSLSLLGGQEGKEFPGTGTLGLPGGDALGFFDVFTEISVSAGGATGGALPEIVATDLQFFQGGPVGGQLIAAVACAVGCTGAGSVQISQQIPESIFADGFESGNISSFRQALDAGEISLAVRIRIVGTGEDVSVAGLLLPAVQIVATPLIGVPDAAGLTTFGNCGDPTDTNDLLQRHPALDAIFLLNAQTGKFDAAQRALPGNLRPNLPIATGQGMFLRASQPFQMNVTVVEFQAGIELHANCGDDTTNTALLGGHDAISRVATFDASTRKWTVIGKALPPALRTEVPVPTWGAAVTFADAAGTGTLPCSSAACQSFFVPRRTY